MVLEDENMTQNDKINLEHNKIMNSKNAKKSPSSLLGVRPLILLKK